MNSRTGTRVNGIPVSSKTRLAPGDVIQIGETELIVEQVDDIPSTPPSTETGTQSNRLVAPPPATHGLPVYGSAGREDDGLYSEAMLKLARRIQNRVLELLNIGNFSALEMTNSEIRPKVEDTLDRILREVRHEIPVQVKLDEFRQILLDDLIGLGPLSPMLRDTAISEIMINGPENIFVESRGLLYRTPARFNSESHLQSIIQRIVEPLGRHIDAASPMVDARLEDGSRVNAVIPPLALDGSLVTIRKFPANKLTDEDLIRFGSLTRPMAAFLREAVRARRNILVSGGTGSGKTTLLYTLSRLLFRKIQVSDEASSYLVFPINFEFQTLDLSNHNTFLRLFVRVLFDSLEYSNMAFIPYLQQLKKWFIMTVYGTQMQFPNGITQLGNVNKDALNSIAKGLNAALKGTGVHGLENFIQKVCSLPDEFAKALGFHGVLFLLDSFEYCDFFFYPGESFPESLKPVSLSQSLSNVLSNSLYIISLKDEEHFMECFSCDNAALIDTEGFLENLIAPYEIVVRQPPFTLKFEDCLGCSGYIAAFDNIVHHGLSIRENTETSHYATLRTSADFARSKVVKQELSRFCQLLYKAGNTNITKDLLNNLVNAETISISIINKEPNEEEEDQEEESSKQAKLEAVNIVEDDAQSTATVDDI